MKYNIQLQSCSTYDTDFYSVGDIDDLLTEIHQTELLTTADDWGRIEGEDEGTLEYFEALNISLDQLTELLRMAAQLKLVVLYFSAQEL